MWAKVIAEIDILIPSGKAHIHPSISGKIKIFVKPTQKPILA